MDERTLTTLNIEQIETVPRLLHAINLGCRSTCGMGDPSCKVVAGCNRKGNPIDQEVEPTGKVTPSKVAMKVCRHYPGGCKAVHGVMTLPLMMDKTSSWFADKTWTKHGTG